MTRTKRRLALFAAAAVAVTGAAVATTGVLPATAGAAPLAAAATAPTLPGPLDDSFYLPPSPLPDGQPGDVIRWRPSLAPLNGLNANAWQVMYLSTNALGERDAVTGTVFTPKGADPAKTPVVGFAVGTQGPAYKCTPSKALERGTLYDQPAINDSISSGYAVAVTDYEGYRPGEANRPTYMTGQSMGPAVIDSVRAAQRLPQTGLRADAKVIFQGYSQGGGGSLWAAEKQPTYAPELNLVGVAAGGVPADLTEVAKGLDGYLGFGFLAFAAVGLDYAYPDLQLDSYLNETGKKEIADAKANACVIELLTNYPFKRISDYTTSNPLQDPKWQARLAQNKLGQTPPRVPVFQYHALTDEIVNTPQAEALRKTYCSAGVEVQWNTYISDHLTGILAGNGDAHKWIVDRFADKQAPSNC
ncbi:lipase family protein [Actinokineospora bangkokensis]|uniref:Lipase n=1 Tax=Actinokineospora bangkokensis TaxID=1193682 RepID=A0A1Q9LQG0_9PSEU|nr:lipase family protein [Actinokineospora bangkokensis]OLR94269.1 lipase [Actinokineospora bangkokensis]